VSDANCRTNFGKSGAVRGRFAGWAAYSALAATPNGYLTPYAWVLPVKPGGIASYTIVGGIGTVSAANAAAGKNATADLTGSGDITAAVAQLVVSAVAALTASGDITAADARAFLNAAADLTGSGILTATPGALGDALASLAGVGALTPTVRATGTLVADLTPFTELSPQSLASAVWDALADDHTDTATLGGQARFLYLLAHNKVVTDPAAGTFTIYDTDGATILFVADLWQDAAGTTAYSGSGSERRDEFA
jgi:hypothetical protein